jgi:hypothetical protein
VVAVYRYFRSLAADTPFATARDNLIILFEKVLLYSLARIGTAVSSCFLIMVRFFFYLPLSCQNILWCICLHGLVYSGEMLHFPSLFFIFLSSVIPVYLRNVMLSSY